MPNCTRCGNEVDARALACPNCGERVWHREGRGRREPLATVSLATAIAGFVACPLVGSVVAVATGARALRTVRRDPTMGGRRAAVAGVVLGVLGIAWGIVLAWSAVGFLEEREARRAPLVWGAAADREAQSSLRNGLTSAKTIFTDEETYESVTLDTMRMMEPALTFLEGPSAGPGEVSIHVVGPNEIVLAARGATECFAIRDVVERVAGGGTTYARVASETCLASEVPEEAWAASWEEAVTLQDEG
ncbi:MAG TPA: DUF4190 domain-containing protein [Actinomycetota bacterium]|nr:DUF4190 domain-containing protein [Actinomycetota bacterium]